MNSLQSWFRGCVRASLLIVLFAALGLIGLLDIVFSIIVDWFIAPEREKRDPIITPLQDNEVPAYLQPIVAIRREAALACNYHGPIVWYFRGNVTLAEIVAEFGHARVLRKIFGQQTYGIWPNQPMFVFWSPREILGEWDDDLKMDWGLPKSHQVSLGRALVLYLLLLCHHRFNGRSALPIGCWLRTETFKEGRQVCIGYGDWAGYKIHPRVSGSLTRHYMLGIEPANNFSLKRAA